MTAPCRVLVFGYSDMAVVGLRVLRAQGAEVVGLVSHRDDPAETRWFASAAEAAMAAGIPVFLPAHPREPALLATVQALAPDLICSFYYRRLVPPAILAVPRLGAINLHGSLLPKYRGRAPLNWVLVHGETETGVTLHHMDEAPDHGDIVAQRRVGIALEDTALTLWRKLLAAAEGLVAETYPLLAAGRALRRPQDHAAATTFGRRRPADGLIDWSRPAAALYNLIRAVTHPFPGAFGFLDGRRVFLWAARPPAGPCEGPPGRVMGLTADGALGVATGGGLLEVVRLQPADGPEMDGTEFFRGVLRGREACFSAAVPPQPVGGGSRT